MDIFFWLTIIPLFGVIAPIYLCFDETIKPINKVFLFLLLPLIEMFFWINLVFEVLSKETDVNILSALQLPTISFLVILGLCFALIISLVEKINQGLKLMLRLTALLIFSFVIAWGAYLASA
ncbi:MAG: hypothetical protein AAF652_17460 [Cyanobacteria bacterium P01_C01_bin.72]